MGRDGYPFASLLLLFALLAAFFPTRAKRANQAVVNLGRHPHQRGVNNDRFQARVGLQRVGGVGYPFQEGVAGFGAQAVEVEVQGVQSLVLRNHLRSTTTRHMEVY